MTIRYKTYRVNDIQTKYFVMGTGLPVLFLHGAGTNVLAYKEILEQLAQSYMVIGVDMPCFGRADVPQDLWSLSDFGSYFDGYINKLQLEDVTVIGHSFGAGVGLALASKNQKVKKLILIDSQGVNEPKNIPSYYFAFFITKTLAGIFNYKMLSKIISLGSYFLKNVISHPFQQLQVVRIINNSLLSQDIPFEKIHAKTLILWGKSNEIFPVVDAQKLQSKIRDSQLKLVEGNHDWCLFYPQQCVSLIKAFMSQT